MKAAVVALVAGLVIYLMTRDGLVLHAFGSLNLAAPSVIAYQLPDALWQFAFCMAVHAIWRDRRAMIIPLALGLVAEGLVGTFDPLDVIALVSGFAASWIAVARAAGPSSSRSLSRETSAPRAAAPRAASCS